MRYIYVDVLIVVNLYINYFLLCTVEKLTNTKTNNKRKIIAALIGACMALSVFLPTFAVIISVLYKLIGAVLISAISFGKYRLLKNSITFLTASLIFAGIMLFISSLFSANNVLLTNGSVYYDISFISLIIFTALSYLLICVFKNFSDKSAYKNGAFRVVVDIGTKRISFEGIADTGNMLFDDLSGKPVIVCDKTDFDFDLSQVLNNKGLQQFKNMRYLAYSTISGDYAIPVFSPECVEIFDSASGKSKKVDVLIGLAENCKGAVFNPKMLL